MNSAGLVALDADPVTALVALERKYSVKLSLARVLSSAVAKGRVEALAAEPGTTKREWEASPFADRALRGLWRESSELSSLLLRVDSARLQSACEELLGGAEGARFALCLLFGPEGILARARRESAVFRERIGCIEDPVPERIRALALGTDALIDDLRRDARDFRRLLRELRARSRAPLELHTYGWGEISRTVGLVRHSTPLAAGLEPVDLVYKRMPPFSSRDSAEHYVAVYEDYNRRLRDDVGIAVPDFGHRIVAGGRGKIVVLVTQARLEPRSIAKQLLLHRDPEQCRILFRMVLDEYRKLARYNRAHQADGVVMGLDGQIPNWAVRDYGGEDAPLRGDEGLIYVDTNTPMMRREGKDCLPIGFYLRGLPAIIRPLLRPMAKKVLDRYFDLRIILLDFLANTSIHGRGELVEAFLPEGNAFLAEGTIEPSPRPITAEDVQRYIRSDVATWRLMRSARKVQEMLQAQRGPVKTAKQIYEIYSSPLF